MRKINVKLIIQKRIDAYPIRELKEHHIGTEIAIICRDGTAWLGVFEKKTDDYLYLSHPHRKKAVHLAVKNIAAWLPLEDFKNYYL